MNEKPKRKFSDIIKDNLQKLMIVVVAILYIVQGVFAFGNKEATLIEVLGSIALSVVVGVILSLNLESMGVKDGRNSQVYKSSVEYYAQIKEKATPYFDKLATWCEYKNAYELELKRKDIIISSGLNWKAYKLGYYEKYPERIKNNEQKQAIEKAKNCKIAKLTTQELLSDLPKKQNDKDKFGEDIKSYQAKAGLSDIASKVLCGVISGMYTLTPLINGENWQTILANVLWNAIQIAIWLIFGALKYAKSKDFVENEYRQTHIIAKTEYLNEFIITMDNNPDVIKNFEDDGEIDDYIKEFINGQERKGDILD